jgi:outer membrane protein assembly factor BamE (lipoprotein component of BamABCDE complex)
MILKQIIILVIFAIGFAEYVPCQTIKYPYTATAERKAAIKHGFKKIKKGMTYQQVRKLMGEPDETKPLYQPRKHNPKQIGTTYWYIIQRIKESGSVNQKDEILVRVSFNLSGKVIQIDQWGF